MLVAMLDVYVVESSLPVMSISLGHVLYVFDVAQAFLQSAPLAEDEQNQQNPSASSVAVCGGKTMGLRWRLF